MQFLEDAAQHNFHAGSNCIDFYYFNLIWLVTDLVILNKNTSGGASFPGGAPGLQNR